MKIRLLCVGRPRDALYVSLHDRYAERLRKLAHYDTAWVRETRADGRYSDEHVRQREASALVDQLEPRSTLVALEPTGECRSSEQLSQQLERWASPSLTVAVGGPLGLHHDLLKRADHLWSLSNLTFPHEMVRVIVAEQLYRALTLLRGLPYHK